MPYRQIHWIKLEKRLLNDHRFYLMDEASQLVFVKLLMVAAETKNKIPKSPQVLTTILRCTQGEGVVKHAIEEIKNNFPKFIETKNFYCFKGFENRHNQVYNGISLGYSSESIDKTRLDQIKNRYIYAKGWDTASWDSILWNDFHRRNSKAAKELFLLNKDVDLACKVIDYVAESLNSKNLDWTLETCCKWVPKFRKESVDMDKVKRLQEKLEAK